MLRDPLFLGFAGLCMGLCIANLRPGAGWLPGGLTQGGKACKHGTAMVRFGAVPMAKGATESRIAQSDVVLMPETCVILDMMRNAPLRLSVSGLTFNSIGTTILEKNKRNKSTKGGKAWRFWARNLGLTTKDGSSVHIGLGERMVKPTYGKVSRRASKKGGLDGLATLVRFWGGGKRNSRVCGSSQGWQSCALSHRNYWPTTLHIGRLAYPGINDQRTGGQISTPTMRQREVKVKVGVIVQPVFRRRFLTRFQFHSRFRLGINSNQTIWHDVTFGTAPPSHFTAAP
ncbi:hypothetical protein BDP55DRAFT_631619 [Colletotrichum godetiae]|uniref:Secreted protein n=1 Tax=Colletotrichum godetiae TaxID=1209918 RepID=A0AAJ0AP30_9PEZI|nr:uncharacterized protein BDP55DRAFT_631619 [Colletotrichum godetiae]KAK1675917.1 hypothetical protein BDP55DRAFT_631619 [Colletotrichum godetiae]